ncbi:hypothetical protein MSS88_02055 [bacterium]|nr:hypothetical protein [bacterium]
MSTAKEVLHHPRAWVYARGVSGSPALHERFDALRRSALREGYEIVGQSSDARQRLAGASFVCAVLMDYGFGTAIPSRRKTTVIRYDG